MKKFFAIFFIVVLVMVISMTIWAQAQEATDDPGNGVAPAAESDSSDKPQQVKTPEEHKLKDVKGKSYKVRVHRSVQGEKRIDILTTGGEFYSYYPATGRQSAFNGAPGANAQLQQATGGVITGTFTLPLNPSPNLPPVAASKPWVFPGWDAVRDFISGMGWTTLDIVKWGLFIGIIFLLAGMIVAFLRHQYPHLFPARPAPAVVVNPVVGVAAAAAAPAAGAAGIPAAVPGPAGPLPLNGGAAGNAMVIGTPNGTLLGRRIA